jgi:hypothetical protein
VRRDVAKVEVDIDGEYSSIDISQFLESVLDRCGVRCSHLGVTRREFEGHDVPNHLYFP